MTNRTDLKNELRTKLAEWAARHAISSMACFLDLIWDRDMRLEEMDSLDGAVVIDSRTNRRRVVAQRIRGELRYWLASSRDPIEFTNSGQSELGVVATIDDLARLCDEFLTGAPVRELRCDRRVHRAG